MLEVLSLKFGRVDFETQEGYYNKTAEQGEDEAGKVL
jgi:hypothetical protein